MVSHNRITVNFKEQLYQIVEAEKEKRGMSLSAVIAELIVDGIIARTDKKSTESNNIDIERNYGDINQSVYVKQFPINHVPLPRDIFDTTPSYNAKAEFVFQINSFPKQKNETEITAISLLDKKRVRGEIIKNVTARINTPLYSLEPRIIIVTHATVHLEQYHSKEMLSVKVVYHYLHTLLHPKEGDAQKYLLDVMKIRYMRYRDVLIRAAKYPHYSTVLYLSEAKTRTCGGYFVGVRRKPIKFGKMKERVFKKNGAYFALFINDEVIRIKKKSFRRNKKETAMNNPLKIIDI